MFTEVIHIFSIEDNEMTIVQGDTGIFDFKLDNETLSNGYVVYFTVKKNKNDKNIIIQKMVNTFTDGIAKFILTSQDTNIQVGKYYYDIEVNTPDNRVDTVIIPTRFKVISGVKDNV